jgi:hypothetical protein
MAAITVSMFVSTSSVNMFSEVAVAAVPPFGTFGIFAMGGADGVSSAAWEVVVGIEAAAATLASSPPSAFFLSPTATKSLSEDAVSESDPSSEDESP